MEVELLCDNEWLQLKNMVDKENDINGYVFSHEIRCNGKIVAIMPYCKNRGLMLRSEVTPCWHPTEEQLSSITGGVDTGNTVEETAIHELKEEANIDATEGDLINLGECRGTKSTDTVYHLFGIDVTGVEDIGKGEGDGSALEAKAHCLFVPAVEAYTAVDPIVGMLYLRLQEELDKQGERMPL